MKPMKNILSKLKILRYPPVSVKKLLGINIDNKLSFDYHVAGLCSKASQKLHALSRISHFMKTKQRQIIMKSFIHSQFGYCPLVWMFHSRKLNNRINKIHERSLRIVYDDSKSTFRELLNKDNSFTIHERNIQTLAIELYKVVNGISPQLMSGISTQKICEIFFKKSLYDEKCAYRKIWDGNIGTLRSKKVCAEIPL